MRGLEPKVTPRSRKIGPVNLSHILNLSSIQNHQLNRTSNLIVKITYLVNGLEVERISARALIPSSKFILVVNKPQVQGRDKPYFKKAQAPKNQWTILGLGMGSLSSTIIGSSSAWLISRRLVPPLPWFHMFFCNYNRNTFFS